MITRLIIKGKLLLVQVIKVCASIFFASRGAPLPRNYVSLNLVGLGRLTPPMSTKLWENLLKRGGVNYETSLHLALSLSIFSYFLISFYIFDILHYLLPFFNQRKADDFSEGKDILTNTVFFDYIAL